MGCCRHAYTSHPAGNNKGPLQLPETYNLIGVRADGTRCMLIEQLLSQNQAELTRSKLLGRDDYTEYPEMVIEPETLSLPGRLRINSREIGDLEKLIKRRAGR